MMFALGDVYSNNQILFRSFDLILKLTKLLNSANVCVVYDNLLLAWLRVYI